MCSDTPKVSAKRNATTTISTCWELNAEDEAVSSTISVPSMTRYTGKWRPRRVVCHIRMIYGRGRGGWAAHSAPHSFPCMHYELCFQNRHTRIGDKMRSHHFHPRYLQCRKQRRRKKSSHLHASRAVDFGGKIWENSGNPSQHSYFGS